MAETFDLIGCDYVAIERLRHKLGRKAAVLLVGDEAFFTMVNRWQTQQRLIPIGPGELKWNTTDNLRVVLSDAVKENEGRFEPWPEEWKVTAWPNV